jgi:glycosyltransferase involved in cell wall biosynthesis
VLSTNKDCDCFKYFKECRVKLGSAVMISGFMIVKDVLKQGYPFVEAIASALPICDEFLISDGYSTDGTYEVVKRISSLNPKVKVYRQKWPDKKISTVLTDVTNELRSKCSFQYILSVQANEIIHEQSAPFIKALPTMFPNLDTLSFPYTQFLNKYKFAEGFRLRFAKNHPEIVAKDDAWTLGASTAYINTKILRSFAHPRRLYYYMTKGVEFVHANPCYDYLSRAIYLPNPVFRYWAVFPKNFLEKCQRHGELFQIAKFQKSYDTLKLHIDEPDVFWKLGSEFLEFAKGEQYPEAFGSVERKNHPAIIQEFISNSNANQYYVREELFDLIKKL